MRHRPEAQGPAIREGRTVTYAIRAVAALMLLSSVVADAEPSSIPDSEIAALRRELSQPNDTSASPVARRRVLKGIVRQGERLIRGHSEAPNRFALLAVILESQKRLLAMDNVARNREALFETCEALMQAPDAYAEARLEADLLLSERRLSERNATLAERAEALTALIARYRGTAAEARSLLLGALIVQKLDASELEHAIHRVLDERYPDDHEVIEFRRRHLKVGRLDVLFRGAFNRLDGTEIRFPSDTSGHMCLLVFWSQKATGYADYLTRIEAERAVCGGPVDVFSFNLDDLRDGGAALLRQHDLDWTVLRLPGGRAHAVYRTYAQGDPVSVLVNGYGFAVLRPEIVHGRQAALEDQRISEARYLAALQALFVGDFLALGPASALPSVRPHLVAPPFRYRLSRDEALGHYAEAAAAGAETSSSAATKAERDRARNCRIVALMGMWNLACEPKHLTTAVAEAKAALEQAMPPEVAVIPRFCLARAALRQDREPPETVVDGFLEACGGPDAPAAALAAACVLAIDARSRALHETLRTLFLERHGGDPEFHALTAFLRDRYHRFYLLRPNHSRRERPTRSYIVDHEAEPVQDRLPEITLTGLDGNQLTLPNTASDRLTYLLFVEPPADPGEDFPERLDRNGKPTRNDYVRGIMDDAQRLTESHVNQGIDFVAAFLTDDADQVRMLMAKNGWTCRATMVSGGLANPMVRRLGIASADRVPNVFILRRDGTVAWRASGHVYKSEFGFPFAFLLAMKVHVERCDAEHGFRLLQAGDYAGAATVFSGPFRPARPERFGWRSPRYHGLAVACMGLQQWEPALEAIEKAIDDHKLKHFHGFGRRSKNVMDWRKDAAKVTLKQPCDVIAGLWKTKLAILEQLGRTDAAAALRQQLRQSVEVEESHIYKRFHERLAALRQAGLDR